MGQWGYYDDEGDAVHDSVYDIKQLVLPEDLKHCWKYRKEIIVSCENKDLILKDLKKNYKDSTFATWTDGKRCSISWTTEKYDNCIVDSKQYMNDHLDEVWDAIESLIKKNDFYKRDEIIAGIAVFIARGWKSTPIMGSEEIEFPKKLRKDFPKELRVLALESSINQYESLRKKKPEKGWKNNDKRLDALEEQIELFSD